jgi:hypothetical protein
MFNSEKPSKFAQSVLVMICKWAVFRFSLSQNTEKPTISRGISQSTQTIAWIFDPTSAKFKKTVSFSILSHSIFTNVLSFDPI